MRFSKFKLGFTLVEVIVTVSVIALLAAATLVVYTNWTKQVLTTQIKSDLTSAAAAMEDYKNFSTGYPSSIPSNFTPSKGVTISIASSSSKKYCINGSSSDHSSDSSYYYHIQQDQTSAVSGQCGSGTQVVPGVPTSVAAVTQSSSSVKLTWSAVSGATKYSVQRSTDSGFANSVVTDTVYSTSFISSSLSANTTYYYRLSASNDAGSSSFSSIVNATTSQGSCSSGSYGTYPNCYSYDSLPVGTSISGYFTSAPSGYLLEDGSAVSRTTYAALFAVIGTTYGAGDGSTTFNLPDSRGRVNVNLNSSDSQFSTMGEKYGEITHTLTIAEIPSHAHEQYVTTNSGGSGIRQDYGGDVSTLGAYTTGLNTGYVGGNQAYSMTQSSIVKLAVIKWKTPPVSDSNTVPAGTSLDGYFTSAPSGYLLEDGSAVSRTTYAALFAVIGTTYGAGDGSTTFNLPDSRGRVGVNRNSSGVRFNSVGEKTGEKTHTLSISEMVRHAHEQYVTANSGTGSGVRSDYRSDGSGYYSYDQGITTGYTGGGGSHNIIQPSITTLSVIKTTGTVDSSAVLSSPVGTSISGYFTSAPSGYLLEDGSAVSRTTYAALFAVIGTTYGAGDGSTTFNLPDSRGRVGVNKSSTITQFNTVGKVSGSDTHTMTISELPSHAHEQYITANSGQGVGVRLDFVSDAGGFSSYDQGITTGYTGGGLAYNIVQPSIVKLYAIKY